MNRVLVIGAAGQIGRRLIPLLTEADLRPRAMVRKMEQKPELEALGAEVVEGDLEGNFAHAFDDCDAVVFTAGSGAKTGADKTMLVDLWGALKTIDEAGRRSVKRYVMISARNADNPDRGPESRRHYLVAKYLADNALMQSGVPYTVLRPGRLLNDSGTGKVRTKRPAQQEQQIIPREDVAQAVVHCLQQSNTKGKTYELYSGDTPIADALN